MKYIIILFTLFSTAFSQTIYDYGNIDMHGGKKSSLVDKKSKGLKDSKMGLSNFLDEKKQKENNKNKNNKKVKKLK